MIINGTNVRMVITGVKHSREYELQIISKSNTKFILTGFLCEELGINHYLDLFKKDVEVSITYKDVFQISKEAKVIECSFKFQVNESASYKLILESK